MTVVLTVYVEVDIVDSRILWWINDIVLEFFLNGTEGWARWEETRSGQVSIREVTSQVVLVRTIEVGQFDIIDLHIVFVVVVLVLGELHQRFWSEGFQVVRTVVEDSRRFDATKVFTCRLKEFFIDGHHGRSCQFRIPERFRLSQSVLEGMVVNSFDSNFREVRIFTGDIVIQAGYWVLNQVEGIWFVVRYVFQRSDEVLCSDICIFVPFWVIPFCIFTKFVSISQSILRNRPIFC